MATLDEVLQRVRENQTVLTSLNTLLDSIRQQVTDILTGAQVPPAIQAKINTIFAELGATGQELADVLVENTPAAPGGGTGGEGGTGGTEGGATGGEEPPAP